MPSKYIFPFFSFKIIHQKYYHYYCLDCGLRYFKNHNPELRPQKVTIRIRNTPGKPNLYSPTQTICLGLIVGI